VTVLQRPPRLHQLSGRPQRLAAGAGAEGGHGPARRRQLQARLPRRRGRGPAPDDTDRRCTLWSRTPPSRPSPAPISAPGGPTGCPPTATGRPCPMCATPHRKAYLKGEVSDGIIAPGYTPEALAILDQEKGQLQRGGDRPRLRSRPCGAQGGVRHHL
jgi:hypothetical protein